MRDSVLAALQAFCEAGTPRAGRRLLKALAKATLIFPTAPQSEGQPPSLAFTSDAAGQPVLPAFTDEPCVLRWLPDGSEVVTAAASGFAPAKRLRRLLSSYQRTRRRLRDVRGCCTQRSDRPRPLLVRCCDRGG